MRWEGNRQSSNVEDRRGSGGGGGFGIGGGRGIGLGTIVLALVGWGVFGINPLTTIGLLSGSGAPAVQPAGQTAQKPPADDKNAAFVATILASTEDVWAPIFSASGLRYQPPKVVLYRGATPTACGTGQSAMGPFYCPADYKVYLDMDFFDTMTREMGAPGEFARAYVIAHEVGHHVQTLSGRMQEQSRVPQSQANAWQVRLELQADCYAGIWANKSQQARQWMEQGDIESAINAAAKVGDDHIQHKHTGVVRPETFTHGSSAQRQRWFMQGFKTGSVQACDTFGAASL